MVKSYFLLFMLLLSYSVCIAQADWVPHQSDRYTILFPKKVTTRVDTVPSELGQLRLSITLYDASADKDDNVVYAFYETAYPDSIVHSDKTELLPRFFRGAIDGAVKKVNGKLLTEKEIMIGRFPGREIKVSYNEGEAMIKMRCYLVHNIMYIQQLITMAAKDGNAAANQFMESFHLK